MSSIAAKLQQVGGRIAAACAAARRPVQSVTLLAVSKTQPANAVREAFAAGQHRFGENYVQEALTKQAALVDLRPTLEWHLIGPLQSNKTRVVAEAFDWVHTVDSVRLAERLSAQRPAWLPPLNVCLQVNVDGEVGKNGLAPEAIVAVATAVAQLPRLTLRGLMSIPTPNNDPAMQRRQHHALAEHLHALRTALGEPRDAAAGASMLDTLSMGMSADLEAAVAEGATLVRVGAAVFGERAAKTPVNDDAGR